MGAIKTAAGGHGAHGGNPAACNLFAEIDVYAGPAATATEAPTGSGCLPLEPVGESNRRPRFRAECLNGLRPCPFVGCFWHLAWELKGWRDNFKSGEATLDELAEAVVNMKHTCTLDFAGTGTTLRPLAETLGITHQALSDTCQRAKARLAELAQLQELAAD